MSLLSLALTVLGLAKGILDFIASRQTAEGLRARIILSSLEAQDARIQKALTARGAALAQLVAGGVSDDTAFRD